MGQLWYTFGVQETGGVYPGCAAARRPWALEFNAFGIVDASRRNLLLTVRGHGTRLLEICLGMAFVIV